MGESQELLADRRPIAARHWRLSRSVASWLMRCGISANAISVAGMLCGIAAGVALAATVLLPELARLFWLLGALLILLRLLANMFDGMVALASGTNSPLGELLNEVPDRISDAATLIGCGYAAGGAPILGFGAACVALFVAYVRAVAKVAGAPQDYCGPMAKQQRMFAVIFVAIFSGIAPSGWQPTWGESKWGLATAVLTLIIGGGGITALRRLWRAGKNLRRHP
jgi:phosphatidylglycerophosphate synthase